MIPARSSAESSRPPAWYRKRLRGIPAALLLLLLVPGIEIAAQSSEAEGTASLRVAAVQLSVEASISTRANV